MAPPAAPRGAQPAQPSPGTCTPAIPATPANPNANPNATPGAPATPSRSDQPTPATDPFRNNPALKEPTGTSGSNRTGTATSSSTTAPSSNTTGQVNVSGDTMIRGLVNITNITNINIQPGNIVNINTAMNPTQVQALMQSLSANRQAMTNAQALTTRLQQQGLLQPGQSVVGFSDGQAFVSSSGNGTTNAANASNAANAPTTDSMIKGLAGVNAAQVSLQARNIVSVSSTLDAAQMQSLTQALNANAQATANAQALSRRLQQQGLLRQGQQVVGFADGQVFVTGP